MKAQRFYTYIHSRADDGRVFYVGKGTGHRATSAKGRNEHWHRVRKKHGISVQVTARWPSEAEAFEHERFLIKCLREMGHPLCNQTGGGEGPSGYRHTEATRRKMSHREISGDQRAAISRANKGLVRSAEFRANVSAGLIGRPVSEETRKKMSLAHKGHEVSRERREKISKALTGKRLSDETRAKLSAIASTPERKARQSAAMAGKPWSEARRAAHVSMMQRRSAAKEHQN